MACENSTNATVKFRKPGELWRSFTTDYCPVRVEVISIIGGQCNCVIYVTTIEVLEYATIYAGFPTVCQKRTRNVTAINFGPILGVEVGNPGTEGVCGAYFKDVYINSRGRAFEGCGTQRFVIASANHYFLSASIKTIVRQDGQPDTCGNLYTLKIFDARGLVYSQTFDKQPEYTIQCGDCPEGYCKCDSTDYPGYCCLPCKPTAQKISNLAERIK